MTALFETSIQLAQKLAVFSFNSAICNGAFGNGKAGIYGSYIKVAN